MFGSLGYENSMEAEVPLNGQARLLLTCSGEGEPCSEEVAATVSIGQALEAAEALLLGHRRKGAEEGEERFFQGQKGGAEQEERARGAKAARALEQRAHCSSAAGERGVLGEAGEAEPEGLAHGEKEQVAQAESAHDAKGP